MKLSNLRTFVLSLGVVIAPVGLMAQAPIHATVPFDFTVGSKSLAAGNYRVAMVASGALSIRNADTKSGVIVLAQGGSDRAPAGKVHLIFKRYGNQYFLSQVSRSDEGWEVLRSRDEKELILKQAAVKVVELAAATGN